MVGTSFQLLGHIKTLFGSVGRVETRGLAVAGSRPSRRTLTAVAGSPTIGLLAADFSKRVLNQTLLIIIAESTSEDVFRGGRNLGID